MNSTKRLIQLCHHRWNVPLLAVLYQLSGAKFITLVNKLELSRDSLSRTLEVLIQHGWVMRNEGYGHPLRPEYIFTPEGSTVGQACHELLNILNFLDIEKVGLKKWSLPVIYTMCLGHHRFSNLKEHLPDITPRALTQTLEQLEQAKFIHRQKISANSNRNQYDLTMKDCPLCAALIQLAGVLNESD